MLSLAKCKTILKSKDFNMTDQQILELRDKLYFLANLEFTILNQTADEESNNLHQSKYRRAS